MATINQIPMTIMGNLVSGLEPKRTSGGKTVVNFRVAQTSSTERNGKWEDGATTFIRCVAYGPIAEHMTESGMGKGTRVVVTGRYVQRDYQTEAGRDAASTNSLRTISGRRYDTRPSGSPRSTETHSGPYRPNNSPGRCRRIRGRPRPRIGSRNRRNRASESGSRDSSP